MNSKKNPKADLSKKTGLFFNVGMVVTMLAVTFAFEWKSYENNVVVDNLDDSEKFEDYLPPVTINTPPPPPPKPVAPIIEEVKNEEIIDDVKDIIDIQFDPDSEIPEIPVEIVETDDEPIDEAPVFIADNSATFPGGIMEFYNHLKKSLNYPKPAKRMGIEGRVFVQFIVEKDGSLTDVRVVKGIGGGCDEEAVRVLKNSPKWNPAKQRGKKVRQKMIQAIQFKLGR